MAQAELPVLCTQLLTGKESFGGCLDQGSALTSSVWLCLSTLLPSCSRRTAVEQNPAGKAGGELVLLFLDVHDNTAQKTGDFFSNKRFIYTSNLKKKINITHKKEKK